MQKITFYIIYRLLEDYR